ncbi:MAG: ABC transporter ATP-binding protein [Candidatus Omnitrophica bacterium]|nr:ABC transporter ATP-binding protein [Candidatus Omnitrophota bacterium]
MLCQLNNVSKRFLLPSASLFAARNTVRAVDRIDLDIAHRETLSLVGESGSGKTTLGRIIADLYRPDQGTVFYKGEDIRKMSRRKYGNFRRSVQVVFQDPFSSLDPRFNVQALLKEAFTLQRTINKQQQRHLMGEMLKAVGLSDDVIMRYPHEFSGGERQRLAIARTLLSDPKLVILDEAVSSLDVLVQKQILDLLNDLKTRFDLTYVFISHNLRVVTQISDRIAVMFNGKIVEIGPARDVVTRPQHPYTKELLGAAMEYKTPPGKRDWVMSYESLGQMVSPGHWVMNIS